MVLNDAALSGMIKQFSDRSILPGRRATLRLLRTCLSASQQGSSEGSWLAAQEGGECNLFQEKGNLALFAGNSPLCTKVVGSRCAPQAGAGELLD